MENMKPSEIVSELTYQSYAHNRQLSPDISPERWAKVFGVGAALMEERFHNERGNENDRDR